MAEIHEQPEAYLAALEREKAGYVLRSQPGRVKELESEIAKAKRALARREEAVAAVGLEAAVPAKPARR